MPLKTSFLSFLAIIFMHFFHDVFASALPEFEGNEDFGPPYVFFGEAEAQRPIECADWPLFEGISRQRSGKKLIKQKGPTCATVALANLNILRHEERADNKTLVEEMLKRTAKMGQNLRNGQQNQNEAFALALAKTEEVRERWGCMAMIMEFSLRHRPLREMFYQEIAREGNGTIDVYSGQGPRHRFTVSAASVDRDGQLVVDLIDPNTPHLVVTRTFNTYGNMVGNPEHRIMSGIVEVESCLY